MPAYGDNDKFLQIVEDILDQVNIDTGQQKVNEQSILMSQDVKIIFSRTKVGQKEAEPGFYTGKQLCNIYGLIYGKGHIMDRDELLDEIIFETEMLHINTTGTEAANGLINGGRSDDN